MDKEFFDLPLAMPKEQAVEIRKCNEYSAEFGVTFLDADIVRLIENRKESLKNTGRVEFSG